MDPVTLRAAERILDAVMGGVSIYLGYRLFMKIPEQTDSQGRITFTKDFSIYLNRVGPGIFFALFGALVIGLSLSKATSYEQYIGAPSQSPVAAGGRLPARSELASPSEHSRYTGFGGSQTDTDKADLESLRLTLREDMILLNTVPTVLRPDLRDEQKADIENAVPRVKLDLMRTVWSADWGDFAQFEPWALKRETGPPPKGLEKAAEYYRSGESQ